MFGGNSILLFLAAFTYIFAHSECGPMRDAYMKVRHATLQRDGSLRTGGQMFLNASEKKVNDHLMMLKQKEYDAGTAINGTFPPSLHFFSAKPLIEKSPVFQILKKMPKGAALHVHDQAVGSVRWLIKHATYDPNCHLCHDQNGILEFHFYEKPPKNPGCEWKQVDSLRNLSGDVSKFDEGLFREMTLVVDNPAEAYPSIDAVWIRFLQLFRTAYGLVFYGPVFRSFYYQCLLEYYEDNVQYIEMRVNLPHVYELDGTVHDLDWAIAAYESVTQQFKKDHPDFSGAKIINSLSRSVKPAEVLDAVKLSIKLAKKYPDTFVGFDLVGPENWGKPLIDYLDVLLYPVEQGLNLKYFFHAGETFWKDVSTDINILDALLLNTTRIGHGYAITKHPEAMRLARERDIPIEVCPISNQVLKLVDNLQNHPASDLLAQGFPMVISSDDPGFWDATGLSYDFYEAFMGLGGMWSDLATLKQLSRDSIRYSAMSDKEKELAFRLWQDKWDAFIDDILSDINLRKNEL